MKHPTIVLQDSLTEVIGHVHGDGPNASFLKAMSCIPAIMHDRGEHDSLIRVCSQYAKECDGSNLIPNWVRHQNALIRLEDERKSLYDALVLICSEYPRHRDGMHGPLPFGIKAARAAITKATQP